MKNNNKGKGMGKDENDESKSKNVISLVPNAPPEDDPALIDHLEKKGKVVDYLRELADMVESGELPGDRAVLLFYEMDEDEDGFRFSPRTVGITNSEAVTLCELAKGIFIREMLGG